MYDLFCMLERIFGLCLFFVYLVYVRVYYYVNNEELESGICGGRVWFLEGWWFYLFLWFKK